MMGILFRILIATLWMVAQGAAQPLSGLARVDAAESGIVDRAGGVELELALSQPVPYRLRLLDGPPRLVADFNVVDWTGVDTAKLGSSTGIEVISAGPIGEGWSRLAMVMREPMIVASAQMQVSEDTGAARLTVRLDPTTPEIFHDSLSPAETGPEAVAAPERHRQDGSRPLRVVLDPGHGGIDPGAEREGLREADLMLIFATELREILRRAGMDVILTREEDVFVPLETRISVAHATKADVLISLHADALSEGRASGATVYTLSESATDEASAKLAERHDRADLLAGVDLTRQDDVVADVLMDLARIETAPRGEALADALVAGLRENVGGLHKRPRLQAGFSVLKSPSVPSVLVELGFLSSARDRDKLIDPAWRQAAAAGIRDALLAWAREDAAEAALLRH